MNFLLTAPRESLLVEMDVEKNSRYAHEFDTVDNCENPLSSSGRDPHFEVCHEGCQRSSLKR